jgi:hypothetical protein
VENSPEVVDIILDGWLKRFGGGIDFEPDIDALIEKALTALDHKREALGLPAWDPQRFGQSGDQLMEEVLAGLEEGEPLNVYSASR